MRIAIAALLLSGCTLTTDLEAYECQSDLDCGAGRICAANNLCLLSSSAPECGPADLCAEGELCAAGKCEAEESVRWGCSGGMSEGPIAGSSKVTLRMQVLMRTAGGAAPLAGAVKAVACALPTCDDMQGPFMSDRAGVLEVVVHQGFEGFVKLTGEGFMDTLYQLQTPLNTEPAGTAEVMMLSVLDVNEVAQAAGAELNLSERGVVLLQVRDCVGDLSEDVSVTGLPQSAAGDIVYLTEDLSEISAAHATTGSGLVIVLDAASGTNEFEFARKTSSASSAALGSLKVKAVAGAITYAPYQVGR